MTSFTRRWRFLSFFCSRLTSRTVCSLLFCRFFFVCSSSVRSLRPTVESIAAKEYFSSTCARSRRQRMQRSSLVRLARPQTHIQTMSSSRA